MKELNKFPLNIQFFGEGDGEEMISKATYDKKVSELNKKAKELEARLNEKLTDDEKRASELKSYQDRIAELEKANLTSSVRTGLVGAGLKNEEVETLTKSIVDGDYNALVTGFSKVIADLKESHAKELEKAKLENVPTPEDKGKEDKPLTREQISKMSLKERQAAYQKNPDLFKELY